MDVTLAQLLGRSTSVAEILTGAYGYLSAAVDNYLHSDAVTTEMLKAEFEELQAATTEALQRHFNNGGMSMHDFALGIAESAEKFDLTPIETHRVVRQALDVVFPITPVTKP